MYLVCANKRSGGGGELAATNMCMVLSKHDTTYFFSCLEVRLYIIEGRSFFPVPLRNFIWVFCKSKCIYSHLYISNIITLFLSVFFNKNIVIFNQGSPKNISFLPALQVQLIKFLYPLAKKIYCVSTEVCQDLIDLGLAKTIIEQINNPLLLENRPNVIRSTDTYIYLGRITAIKNIHKILSAAQASNTKLNVYGTGYMVPQLEKSFPNIWRNAYKGHTDNAVAEIARSKALILMSEREGIPMVALEAIYTSTPLIIPKNLTSMHFLLGSHQAKHGSFSIHANGIMLHDNDISILTEVLEFLKNQKLEVSEKSVLDDFSVERFEKEMLLI